MLKSFLRHRMADNEIDDIAELIEKSGISRNTINKLFRSKDLKTIRVDTLIKLCDVFHCKMSELLEYYPDEKPHK